MAATKMTKTNSFSKVGVTPDNVATKRNLTLMFLY